MFRAWRRPDASRFSASRQEKIARQCVFAHRVPVESSSGAVRRRARGAHGSRSVLLGGVVGLIVAVVGICSAEWAAAQDTITVLTDAGAETRLGGRVVEFYGGQLLLMLPGGRQRSIPAEKVLKIETQYTASYAAAEKAFLARRFDQALTLYRRALEEEPRRWVRRQTLARMVWCYRALDRWMEAGQTFLLLWQSDPQTPYFDCIPLCWVPRQPSAELEQSARNWLAGPEPVKILLGASHLVNTAARQQALAQLARLTAAEDRRIALLAAAQGWRASLPQTTAGQLAGWAAMIEQLPEGLRAGPSYVLGTAWLRQQDYQQAALWLLRAPLLDPRHRQVAARALIEAARALEQLGKPHQAGRLYAEVVRDYAEQTRAVAEARSRIEMLQGQSHPQPGTSPGASGAAQPGAGPAGQ